MVYADLHVHTKHSDGTVEIKDVLQQAIDHGVKAIAICDHDTIHHYDEIYSWGKKLGIETIRGVEMSCYDDEVSKKIHIIGLWLNAEAPHVEKLCHQTLMCRDRYHHQLIESLKEKGYSIQYEDAKKYSPYNIVFKMHIFQALMDKYPNEMTPSQYRQMFASGTSLEVDKQMGYIDIKTGIEAIHQDGGIAIIAHPCEYDNYDEIEKYISYGLDGIEISHPSMKEIDYLKVARFVEKFSLIKSGGSDFHDERLTMMGEYGLSYEDFISLKEYARKVHKMRNLNIRNFRDIHGYVNTYGEVMKPHMIYRGAALNEISLEDASYMEKDLGIHYILDYRDEQEASLSVDIQFPHAVYKRIGALQTHHNTNEGFDFGAMLQGEMDKEKLQFLIHYIRDGYRTMPFDNPAYHHLFEVLLRGDGHVYFHCSAGKDRTGVSAFLIMIALGMSEEDAIKEYLISNDYLKPFNDQLMVQLNIPISMQKYCEPLLFVEKENILLTISSIKEKYSNYDDFLLKEYGLNIEKRERLRLLYCEKR